MSGPYDKPPRHPAEAGGGHAPIPSVPVAARRHGAIPSAPEGSPRRPSADEGNKTTPIDRWAFKYSGNAGPAQGENDAEDWDVTTFKPAIELEAARPLTVLFYQDTDRTQTPNVPTSRTAGAYTYDASSTADGEGIALGRFRLDAPDDEIVDSTRIWIAIPDLDNLYAFLQSNVQPTIEITWGSSYLHFTVDDFDLLEDGGVQYLDLHVTPADSLIADGPPGAPETTDIAYTFDATTSEGGQASGSVRMNLGGASQPDSVALYIHIEDDSSAETIEPWLTAHTDISIELQYGTSSIVWAVDLVERLGDYLRISVTPDGSTVTEGDGPLDNGDPLVVHLSGVLAPVSEQLTDGTAVDVLARGFAMPNATVRARVRYRLAKSEVEFDCDWAGGFQVFADRLELSRVRFGPDTRLPYTDAQIDIAATVLANAPRPGGSLALTVPPVPVPPPTGERFAEFPVHPFARRVNLLLKYGNDPDDEEAPGDAPLGQIFLAFVGKFGRSLSYIDAMSAREALFGAGLPIPASGVTKLVISNRSPDDSMQIGVVWRLEL